jgi:hypothetical protein
MKKILSTIENWLQWVLVNGMVWTVALILAWIIADVLLASVAELTGYVVGLIVGGLMVGLLHWQYFHPPSDKLTLTWIIASVVGWLVVILGTTWLFGQTSLFVTVLVGGLVGGGVIGLIQWFALSPEFKEKFHWIVLSSTGWFAALFVGALVISNQGFNAYSNVYQQLGIMAIIGWVLLSIVALVILLLGYSKGEHHYFNSVFKMW